MKRAFKSMPISQKVVDNIEVVRKYGFIDSVLNQKVVSNFFTAVLLCNGSERR
jgi:hypothetical protein